MEGAKADNEEGSVKSAAQSVARVNPFKAFIDQSKVGFTETKLLSEDEKSSKSTKDIPGAEGAPAMSYTEDEIFKAWVQYLDDESGCLYWYNELTGEAKWIEAEEQAAGDYQGAASEGIDAQQQPEESNPNEQQAFPTLILSSAWEKYYDDDGNPFYYNKETGASEWEIPAGDVYVEGYTTGVAGEMKLEMGQAHDTFDGLWLGGDSTKTSSQKEEQKEAGEHESGKQSVPIQQADSKEESSRILKSVSSFRSVRSARSVGLPSPHRTPSVHRLMSKASFSNLVDFDAVAAAVATTPKGMATKVSFSASVKTMQPTVSFRLANSAPQVDNSLKPKSPLKRNSKSGFQMLKEGAAVLREAVDDKGDIWIEYQSAGDGPIFYAIKGTVAGQWGKPQIFSDMDSGLRKKVHDADSSLEEASLGEIVDYFVMENSMSPTHKNPDQRYLQSHSSFDIRNASFASLGELPELNLKPPSKPPSNSSNSSQPAPKSSVHFEEPAQDKEEPAATRSLPSSSESVKVVDKIEEVTPGNPVPSSPPPTEALVSLTRTDALGDNASLVPSDALGDNASPVPSDALGDNASPVPSSAQKGSGGLDDVPPIDQDPEEIHARKAEALQLQIASIQAEAMLELERLKERLDDAKKEHSTRQNVVNFQANIDLGVGLEASKTVVSTARNSPRSESKNQVAVGVVETINVHPESRADEGDVDWIEWYARSHVIHRQGPWIVLQDTATKRRFFRNQDTGGFQFEKPAEIGDIKESTHNPLLKSMTEKTIGRVRDSPTPQSVASGNNSRHTPQPSIGVIPEGSRSNVPQSIAAQTPATKTSIVSGQSPVVKSDDSVALTLTSKESKPKSAQAPAGTSSPAVFPPTPTKVDNKTPEHVSPVREKRHKSSGKPESRSSFLTNVDIAEAEQHPTTPPSEKYNFNTEPSLNLRKELAFVEKATAKELHEFWQRDYQNQDEESNVLLARLQALCVERQTDSYMGGKARHVSSISSLDRDQMRKIHSKVRHIVERCCTVLEQVEISPTERLLNEQHLLKAAMMQKKMLRMPLDPKHDGGMHDFSPTAVAFPTFVPDREYWKSRTDGVDIGCGWVEFTHPAPDASPSAIGRQVVWYYHRKSQLTQRGEPFDVLIKRRSANLKRESWSDYEVKTSVHQSILEQRGIELLVDEFGGYLFYCPVRKEYSSAGVFSSSPVNTESLSSAYANDTDNHVWNSTTSNKVAHLPSKDHLNVWNSFKFTDTITMNTTDRKKSGDVVSKSLDQYRRTFLQQQQAFRSSGVALGTLNQTSNEREDVEESQSWNLNLLEEAFNVARGDLQGYLPPPKRIDLSYEPEAQDLLHILKFEENMDVDTYSKYHSHILNVAVDPENPLPIMELMEFLLLQGLGKLSLAVFKHAIDTMKSSSYFHVSPYEMAMAHVLSQKMSFKYFNFYEKYNSALLIAKQFNESPFILTHIGSYFMKMRCPEYAELLLLAALMRDPNCDFALLKYAHLLVQKGDYRSAQRQLQKCAELHPDAYIGQYAKLECFWVQELLVGQEEHLFLCYKNMLSLNRKDRVQSLALSCLGAFLQLGDMSKASIDCLDFYKRSLVVDSENSQACLLYAMASYSQHMELITRSTSSSVPSQVPEATKLLRPQSANATKRDTAKRVQSAKGTRASASGALRASANGLINNPLPSNVLSIVEIDASYRRGLVLMPDASYRWVVLLSYADFILCTLRDFHRAEQYYAEACKANSSSNIWTVLAQGYYYQYVTNAYKKTYHVYLRALKARCSNLYVQSLESFPGLQSANQSSALLTLDQHATTKTSIRQDRSVDQQENIILFTAIAYLLWDMNNVAVAKSYAIAALQICPTFVPACRCIANLLYFEGERRLCYRYMNMALDHMTHVDNGSVHTLRSAGIMKAIRYQFDDAIKCLERVVAMSPNDYLAHRVLGLLYYQYKMQLDVSLNHFTAAYSISNKEDIEALRLKAQVLMDERLFREARQYLLEALRIVPTDPISLANLAICVFFMHSEPERYGAIQQYWREEASRQIKVAEHWSDDDLESLAHTNNPILLFEAALFLHPRIPDSSHLDASTISEGLGEGSIRGGEGSVASSPSSSSPLPVAYIHFLYGCFELTRGAEDSLPRAQYEFSQSAALLCSPHCPQDTVLLPLVLYQLGSLSEEKGDLYNAERQYEQSLGGQGEGEGDIHALTLLRICSNIDEALAALKRQLDRLKNPFEKKGGKGGGRKKKKKGGKAKTGAILGDAGLEAPFSDFERERERLKNKTEHFEQFAPLLGGQGGGDWDDDDVDDVLPAHNKEASLLVKRILMHQRILEMASIKKFAYQKRVKDIRGAEVIGNGSKRLILPRVSYLYTESDWLNRALYAAAKVEDWTAMMTHSVEM